MFLIDILGGVSAVCMLYDSINPGWIHKKFRLVLVCVLMLYMVVALFSLF